MTLFHWSKQPFEKFDPERMGENTIPDQLHGAHFATYPHTDNMQDDGQILTQWYVNVSKILHDADLFNESEVEQIIIQYFSKVDETTKDAIRKMLLETNITELIKNQDFNKILGNNIEGLKEDGSTMVKSGLFATNVLKSLGYQAV